MVIVEKRATMTEKNKTRSVVEKFPTTVVMEKVVSSETASPGKTIRSHIFLDEGKKDEIIGHLLHTTCE